MSDQTAALPVLVRGLDQLGGLVGMVRPEDSGSPTPCSQWTVAELVDHIVAGPASFAAMVRGEQIDWSAPTPHHDDAVEAFRDHARELLEAWAANPDAQPGPEWQCAEIAVHTWDLSTALGRPTRELDPEVAERGLAFMQLSLTDERRGSAFGPERPAPVGADGYERIAAFAGREV